MPGRRARRCCGRSRSRRLLISSSLTAQKMLPVVLSQGSSRQPNSAQMSRNTAREDLAADVLRMVDLAFFFGRPTPVDLKYWEVEAV